LTFFVVQNDMLLIALYANRHDDKHYPRAIFAKVT